MYMLALLPLATCHWEALISLLCYSFAVMQVKMRIQGSMLHRQVILNNLYDEIDVDGSGSIDSSEFRDMLRALHLHYR